jgi:hypothetical protein
MAQGDQDAMVNYNVAKESAELLKELGYNITFETYRYVRFMQFPRAAGAYQSSV